ncbi:twin-arginine translocase TatA/TatE family subunit [Bacteroidetes/Chlorobi group bacterium MS-B_bin-24]|jgi:sec-independent protein translocase protein TatA|nr:MAG: twin-arginine translocase TatA/TatE family subunit [Bacteroidetes/Chlorobi group bacterium MS-B_bin-24]
MFNLGVQELVLIAVIILLIFGGRKIPELMRGLGQGIREFKKASNIEQDSPTQNNSKQEKTE